jgi:hypothetical protein
MRYVIAVIIIVLVFAGSVAAGYLLQPQHEPAMDAGEMRLRERAEAYYRASRLTDFHSMATHFTPARQYSEMEELRERSETVAKTRAEFPEDQKQEQQKSAEAVSGSELDVQMEEGWAVTSGMSTLYAEGGALPFKLDQVVWVRNAGEWWVYAMTEAELNAYGNPPEFAREILEKRPFKPQVGLLNLDETAKEGEQADQTEDAETAGNG